MLYSNDSFTDWILELMYLIFPVSISHSLIFLFHILTRIYTTQYIAKNGTPIVANGAKIVNEKGLKNIIIDIITTKIPVQSYNS